MKFKLFKWANFEWQGLEKEKYKKNEGSWRGVSRRVFVGKAGEPTSFDFRYFELDEEGYTSLEKHDHAHVVACVRGKGKVIVGDEVVELDYLDVLYIAPLVPHQFVNTGKGPFGFFCVVDRERDRPKTLDREEIENLLRNPEIKAIIKP